MAISTILFGKYYPLPGEFKLICIGKFARRTWLYFAQQYGKNRQRCQQNTFYYAVWQSLLYFYKEIPSKILSVYNAESREREEEERRKESKGEKFEQAEVLLYGPRIAN